MLERLVPALIAAALGIVLAAVPMRAAHAEGRATLDDAVADLAVPAKSKIAEDIKAFLRHGAAAERSSNDLSWDCLAAAALVRRGQPGAEDRLKGIVATLKSQLVTREGAPRGWSSEASSPKCAGKGYDAFNDGTCNAPGTTYAFQTGLAMACFAESSPLLKDPALLEVDKAVDAEWRKHLLAKAPCPGCDYFPISDNANDAGRYVRNMNVFMGFGEAALYAATRDPAMRKNANAALESDIAEVRHGNHGYLGYMDTKWSPSRSEAERIENHSAAVALMALRAASQLSEPKLAAHGLDVWHTWAFCDDERCRKADCTYWAADPGRCQATVTGAHCAFRRLDGGARKMCDAYLGATPHLSSVSLWSVLISEETPPASALPAKK